MSNETFKTNNLTKVGTLIENPIFVFTQIKLHNPIEVKIIQYGSNTLDNDLLSYVLHREGITLAQMDDFIKKRNPIIVVLHIKVGKTVHFQYDAEIDFWDIIFSKIS